MNSLTHIGVPEIRKRVASVPCLDGQEAYPDLGTFLQVGK